MKAHISYDGTTIAYLDSGDGPAVVLLHGYGSSSAHNWVEPGIFAALAGAGLRVIAPDLRGHGLSARPHDLQAYTSLAQVTDVVHLLDALGLQDVRAAGYSMGSTVAVWLALMSRRVSRLVIAGHGDTITLNQWQGNAHVAAGLLAASEDGLDAVQRAYRRFVARHGGDLIAMARVAQADEGIPAVRLSEITYPVLILTGADDAMVGPVDGLASALKTVRVVRPPGDHLTTVETPEFRDALVAFLSAP